MSDYIKIGDCIPTLDELRHRAAQRENVPASSSALIAMGEHLQLCGYTDANPEVFRVIAEYGASELEHKNGLGLFIKGPCGIGKSFGIACLAAYFKWPVIHAKMYQQKFMSEDSEDEFLRFVDALDFFERPQTVVIDDLGAEDYPLVKYGTATNLMADVLDRRYYHGFQRNGVRTIVTSNLTDQQLRERYGLRIDDRLNEMFEFVAPSGRSLRK